MKDKTYIKPGDTIGICAPSASFDVEKFNRGVDVLKKSGFRVVIPEKIFKKQRYLAGDDPTRAQVINQLFADPKIDAILCARGGFGAMRMLDAVNWDTIRENPKPVVGFSDITALLVNIVLKTGIPVIHGPTVLSLGSATRGTLFSFLNTLQGKGDLNWMKKGKSLIDGRCTGRLLGGNLSTLCHLIGTIYQPDFTGSVLFFEDIGEPAYKIDRMLSQMKLAGLFDNINGIITGSFKTCLNSEYIPSILEEIFKDRNIPVLTDVPAGHGRLNHSMVMGTGIDLKVSEKKIELSAT